MAVSLTATGITFPDGTQQTSARYAAFTNRIINGSMTIAQRGTSFVSPATNTYLLDRWVWVNTTTGAVTFTQVTETESSALGAPPYDPATPEVLTSLKMTVTTADTSINTADFAHIAQRIEGTNIADLLTSPSTLSFYVRANVTGTFCVSLRNADGDYSYVIECDYDVANEWQRYVFFIDALPSGGNWAIDNSIGLRVEVTLACGTTYFVGQSQQWYPNKTGLATSSQTNFLGTVGNTFELTAVQLEKNTVYQPKFDLTPYATELALCQRYFATTGSSTRGYATAANQFFTSSISFPQTMRAIPTCVMTGESSSNTNAVYIGYISLFGATLLSRSAAAGGTYTVYGVITAQSEL